MQSSVTTSPQKPEPGDRSFLASFGGWATDARTVLAVLGIVLYAVLRIAYSVFYNSFGLTPDDLGLGYLDLLIQSAVGTIILLLVVFVVAAFAAALYVGMYGGIVEVRSERTRARHVAKTSGLERLPSVRREGESVISRSQARLRRALRNPKQLVPYAFLVLILGGVVADQPVLVLLGVSYLIAEALFVGIKRINLGLTGDDRAWWRAGLVTIAVVTLGLAIFSLLARAESDATRVQHGHASGFTVLGFSITTWGAEQATISWTSNQIGPGLKPLAGRCLMYLGQSNGTAFLYLVSTKEVFRVPTAAVVVRTRPPVCSRKQPRPKTQRPGAGGPRARHALGAPRSA